MKSTPGIAAFALLWAVLVPHAWGEGVLSVGSPTVDGNNVTVPVYLEGSVDSGVAALDFTLRYDPAVLAPGGVRAGEAAVAADKGVQYNMTEPGQYVVMMFGLNQSTMEAGKIADITLRRVGNASAAETNLSIDGTTLASLEGQTIASRGSSATVQLASTPSDDPVPGEPETPPDATPDPDPTTPENETPVTPPVDDGEAAPTDPTDPSTTPNTANPRVPTDPAPDSGAAPASGGNDLGRSVASRSPLSKPTSDAASRLSQLDRMAREFERKRAAIPSPPAGEAGAEESAVPRSAPENSGSTRPVIGRPDSAVRSLTADSNGEVRQMASLAPMDAKRLSEASALAGAANGSSAAPSPGFFTDRRVWIFGVGLVAFIAGFLVRKRLLP